MTESPAADAPDAGAAAGASLPARVLVTGAGGALGAALVRLLRERGIPSTALDLRYGEDPPAERVIEGDTTDPVVVSEALIGCDAVAHLAAIPGPFHDDPRNVHRTNVVSTFTVLSLAGEAGIRRAAIASSINAFGVPFNHRRPLPAYYPLDEDSPSAIDDWYSLSKQQDELTARMVASRWDMSVICLRLPHTGGLPLFDEISARNRADPDAAVREGWAYLHEDDAARAFLLALEPRGPGAVTLMVAAQDTMLPWPTEEALARWAPDVPLHRALPGRSAAVDTARAREVLGFTPAYRFPWPEEVPGSAAPAHP